MYRIQVLNSIVWNTVTVVNWEDSIPQQMQYVKSSYPTKRVRCVDENNQIMDMVS